MKFLATGDIHLTDLPRDEYRWEIFPWLRRQAERRGVDAIFILGDLTDRKDEHPGRLVNRIVTELNRTHDVAPTYVIKGNHDYDADPDVPFFAFYERFIVNPVQMTIGGASFYIYPHTRRFEDDNPNFKNNHDFIFVHHTFAGAETSNGFKMEGGTSPSVLSKKVVGPKCIVLSGDIHVPQLIGNITYCGAPHPITFGDSFSPRVIFFDGNELISIKRTTIKKMAIEITSVSEIMEAGLTEGDQLKVVFKLPRREFSSWQAHRTLVEEACAMLGVRLHSCELQQLDAPRKRLITDQATAEARRAATNEQLFAAFCQERGVDDVFVETGSKLIEEK